MTPASANDTQTALPATSPAAPSSEKIPAPTIAPTPMNAAWRVVTCARRDGAGRPDRRHGGVSLDEDADRQDEERQHGEQDAAAATRT